MSSLRQLLNPADLVPPRDISNSRESHKDRIRLCAPSPTESSSSSENQSRDSPGPPPDWSHLPHDNCPDSLDCLPDTEGRPQYTLPVILRCVILGSTKKRLTIRDIYATMEKKYPYYRSAGPAWKQSVRHHLSLSRLFEKVAKPVTDPGFGSYWTVNLDAPPGTKRPRKRGRMCDKGGAPQDDGASPSRRARVDELPQRRNFDDESSFDSFSPVSGTSLPLQCQSSRQYQPHHAVRQAYSVGGQSREEGDEVNDYLDKQDNPVDCRSLVTNDVAESDEDAIDGWNAHSECLTYLNHPTQSQRDNPYPPISRPPTVVQLQVQVRDLQKQLMASTVVTEKLANELSDAHAEIARLRLKNELLDRGISTGIGQRNF